MIPKKKMGRPKFEMTETMWENFDSLCQLQATLVEISEFFKVSEDTIEARVKETYGVTFSEHADKRRSQGRLNLRRAQLKTALSGNVTMQIWLGKNWLGQKEPTVEIKELKQAKEEVEQLTPDQVVIELRKRADELERETN